MSRFRRYDAFVKTRPDLRSQSAWGGLITLVAGTAAAILFVGQIVAYVVGRPEHTLHVAPSHSFAVRPLHLDKFKSKLLDLQQGTILLHLHITFPHITCSRLDFKHDGASLKSGELRKHHDEVTIQLRKPSYSEWATIQQHGGGGVDSRRFKSNEGCTLYGHMRVPLVAGNIAISMTSLAWAESTSILLVRQRPALQIITSDNKTEIKKNDFDASLTERMEPYNVTHYIHHIRFGESFALAESKPLEHRYHWIENTFGGIALEQIEVKLVPTLVDGFLVGQQTQYQMSVTDHQVHPSTLVAHGVPQLPGLVVAYDFSPLAVHHSSGREHFLVFLSSLLSIGAGVFVTVGLVTGCLVHSAKAVAKKVD